MQKQGHRKPDYTGLRSVAIARRTSKSGGNITFLTLRTCALAVTAAQNTENTAYGVGALANNTDGIGNSAFGLDAGKAVESYILHERELGCGPGRTHTARRIELSRGGTPSHGRCGWKCLLCKRGSDPARKKYTSMRRVRLLRYVRTCPTYLRGKVSAVYSQKTAFVWLPSDGLAPRSSHGRESADTLPITFVAFRKCQRFSVDL